VLVGIDGRVRDARVERSVALLDSAALAAARQWVFRPGLTEEGRPIPVWVAIPMRFGAVPPEMGMHPPAIAERRAALERDLAALHARGPRAPSDSDAVLRQRIIRAAQLFAPMPSGPIEAMEHRESALRTLQGSHARDSLMRAVDELALALDEVPWWAPPYRDIAPALEALARYPEAAVSLELYLVADPKAEDAPVLREQITRLRAKGKRTHR